MGSHLFELQTKRSETHASFILGYHVGEGEGEGIPGPHVANRHQSQRLRTILLRNI